jgi:predicted acylesterase/phospholipase RssA
MDIDTLRVFSFSGGGSKGYGENYFIRKFLQQWGVPQDDFRFYADVMAGVSTGAILAASYAYGYAPLDVEPFYLEKAKRVFTIRSAGDVASGSHNASQDSNRPNTLQKIGIIGLNDAFYQSAYPDSNYGTNILNQTMVDSFGADTLANLAIPIVIPSVEQDRSRPVYFSNFNDAGFFIGRDASIVDVLRATSAAYPYLPAYNFNGHEYIDGAFLIGNAVDRAIKLGLTVKPNARRIVVVDVGAGIGKVGFDGEIPSTPSDLAVAKIFAYLDLLMANAEENSRKNLEYEASRLTSTYGLPLFYYKWQPIFPDTFSNEIDNSTPEWFAALKDILDIHYANESANIASIINHLGA